MVWSVELKFKIKIGTWKGKANYNACKQYKGR